MMLFKYSSRCFLLVVVLLISLDLSTEVRASQIGKSKIVSSVDSVQVTKQKVKDWIKTRIATAKLQNKMKANPEKYDNVVHAFFKERKTLLKSRGWSVDEFEAVEKRITNATSGMEMAEELEESKAEYKKQVKQVKTNKHYSEKQRKQMLETLKKMREEKRKRYINPTKPDWPAVRPYRTTLEKLTDWVAGNVSDPPVVK